MAHYPSTSVLACRVNLGGMTLAVPGSTGFVALAQRAVIGTIDRARSGLRDVRRWWSGAAEPGSECVSDDFAGVGVVGVGACFEGLLEIWVDPDGDDAGRRRPLHSPAAHVIPVRVAPALQN